MLIQDFKQLKNKVLEVAKRLDSGDEKVEEIETRVKFILKEIKNNGLSALKDFTQKFDEKTVSDFKVATAGHFAKLEDKQQKAIELACGRIRKFQEACLPKKYALDDESGHLEVLFKPLDSVGIYVPGGSAPLLSTLMMTAIPALVADVKRIVVVSPPEIDPYILAVADYLGLKEVYQMGGAQAIGALAYGLPEINFSAVDKVVGPGNLYVTLAKKHVYGTIGIDALYGPSELVIVADEKAKAKSIAHDLMSQLEHGSGFEAACLFTNSAALAEEVLREFNLILQKQPKAEAIKKAWANYGIIGVCNELSECVELANLFAPEHLELKVQDFQELLPLIRHAGAIFVGNANEAFGDYLAGPSHCLPTGRSARFSSGLSVMDFLKRSSLVQVKPTEALIEATATLARMEGLEAHAQAAESLRDGFA